MPNYKNYTDKEISEAVKNSKSLAETLRYLNLRPAGGNYVTIKLKITELKLDTSHFLGQSWSKNTFTVPLSKKRSTRYIKRQLISERGHSCESCNLSKWKNNLIPLELEHINGNCLDHKSSNLKLLCPNCHALTSTYRRKKSSLPLG